MYTTKCLEYKVFFQTISNFFKKIEFGIFLKGVGTKLKYMKFNFH